MLALIHFCGILGVLKARAHHLSNSIKNSILGSGQYFGSLFETINNTNVQLL